MKTYKCSECGKEFNNAQSLGGHKSSHMRGESYRLKRQTESSKKKRLKPVEPKTCNYCGREFENGWKLGGHITSCQSNPNRQNIKSKISKSLKDRPLSKLHKMHISKSMKKAHNEGRAWNIGMSRWNNTPSYPETFFMDVIRNEFDDKKYKYEFPIGIYSADFCWEHKKKIIEIDGSQHERFESYRERDKRKDEFVKGLGYEILRISWKEMFDNPKDKIREAYNFIHS